MISFAAPWALAGLLAAAIPILLHLLARREPPTVEFPAVRYLAETARAHQRRLTLQHWLLLVVRTLLIVALVLAAAGPSWPRAGAGGHAPAALVLVMDNSPSAAVTEGGIPMMDRLRRAGRAVLDRATTDDAVWLLAADGVARRGPPAGLASTLDSLTASPRRMDLGQTIGQARQVLAGERRPGEVLVVTDLQASATSPASGAGPLVVARPAGPAVRNAGVVAVDPGLQPWTGDGGRVSVSIAATDTGAVPLTVALADRAPRPALAGRDRPATIILPGGRPGWLPLRVELAPDEFRADDRWVGVVRVSPPARVRWDLADRYLAAACQVLVEGRRIVSGTGLSLGTLATGRSVVMPPADPAEIGAVNRALAARGIPWQYGPRIAASTVTDSGALLGRHRVLVRHRLSGGSGGVLATAGGDPWLVRSGTVILLGSRLDPAWTALPLSAEFVPFLDGLLNRVASAGVAVLDAWPGDPVTLPDQADAVMDGKGRQPVEGGSPWTPGGPGVFYLIRAADTVGAIAVNLDPRESQLARADDASVRALWPGLRITDLDQAAAAAFAAAGQGELRGLLLWLALGLALLEAGLASWRRRSA